MRRGRRCPPDCPQCGEPGGGWPGLDCPESDLTEDQFLKLLAEQPAAPPPATGPSISVDQILDIIRLLSLIFGFDPSSQPGAAARIKSILDGS